MHTHIHKAYKQIQVHTMRVYIMCTKRDDGWWLKITAQI